ncbi:MAG TPA: hypothetical protein VLT58_08000, partial [Polyangia bacterium]|nr:hypothetical protein [Polyangia bacterium]
MARLTMAIGLLALSSLGTGCDSEPEGSCVTSTFSTEFDTYGTQKGCRDHMSASACAAAGGQFDEGGDCSAFNLIQAITA